MARRQAEQALVSDQATKGCLDPPGFDPSRLKPCPFCGNGGWELNEIVNEKMRQQLARDADGKRYLEDVCLIYQAQIQCWMCGAMGPQTAWYDTKDGALAALRKSHDEEGWNDRFSDSDESGEAGETALAGSTVGDSAGRRHRPNTPHPMPAKAGVEVLHGEGE